MVKSWAPATAPNTINVNIKEVMHPKFDVVSLLPQNDAYGCTEEKYAPQLCLPPISNLPISIVGDLYNCISFLNNSQPQGQGNQLGVL